MPNSIELLDVASLLSTVGALQKSTDAELRRAVSSVYYALFHKVLRAAADRFVGSDQKGTAACVILYRSFDHGHMKMVCDALKASTLKDKYKHQLRRNSVSQDMREFAQTFQVLQDLRLLADYDPASRFLASDVSSLIDEAVSAMAAFDRAPLQEQTDVLALMLVDVRS